MTKFTQSFKFSTRLPKQQCHCEFPLTKYANINIFPRFNVNKIFDRLRNTYPYEDIACKYLTRKQ